MSGAWTLTLLLSGLWMGVLTVALMVTMRQVGLLTARVLMGGHEPLPEAFGPEVGATLDPDLLDSLPVTGRSLFLIYLSAGCVPCRELVARLHQVTIPPTAVTLLTGRMELANDLAAHFPPGAHLLLDPIAGELARRLNLISTPFFVEVVDGKVARRGSVMGVEHLQVLLREHSENARAPKGDFMNESASEVSVSAVDTRLARNVG